MVPIPAVSVQAQNAKRKSPHFASPNSSFYHLNPAGKLSENKRWYCTNDKIPATLSMKAAGVQERLIFKFSYVKSVIKFQLVIKARNFSIWQFTGEYKALRISDFIKWPFSLVVKLFLRVEQPPVRFREGPNMFCQTVNRPN